MRIYAVLKNLYALFFKMSSNYYLIVDFQDIIRLVKEFQFLEGGA